MEVVSSGYEWEADLARRLARVHPTHMIRGLFLQSYLEQLRELGGEALWQQGLTLCGPAPLVELFRYPVRLQLQLLSLLMPLLVARHGDAEAGLRALGRQGIIKFLSSYTGRLLVKLAGRDTKRILSHAPMGFQVATDFGQHLLEWRSPRDCHWTMVNQFLPCAFHEGVLLGLLESGDARNGRVVGRQTDLMNSEHDISWE